MDRQTHRVTSTDAETFHYIDNDIYSSFDYYLPEEDRVRFAEIIESGSRAWFPLTIGNEDKAHHFYAHLVENKSDALLQLTLVRLGQAMDRYEELLRILEDHRAVFDLYENVIYEYEPDEDCVQLMNTREADFEAGNYTLAQLKELLESRADDRQREQIREFLRLVEGRGRNFRIRIDGNLLSDDKDVSATILTGTTVHHDSASDGVVGYMHPVIGRGARLPESMTRDALTGLYGRKDIIRIATERINDRKIAGEALVVFDVDYFKHVNDTYGHKQGDIVLREVAAILEHEIGENGYVGRIGGDEMIALIRGVDDEERLRMFLREIKIRVNTSLADMGPSKDRPLSLSMGAAVYPKDAENYEDLFMVADAMLYLAKEKGRNRYVIYTPGKHPSLEELRAGSMSGRDVDDHDRQSDSEYMITLLDQVEYGTKPPIRVMLDFFCERFRIANLMIFAGEEADYIQSAGAEAIRDQEKIGRLSMLLGMNSENSLLGQNDFLVVNQMTSLPRNEWRLKETMEACDIASFIKMTCKGRQETRLTILLSSIGQTELWNQQHFPYFRMLQSILRQYDLVEGEH
ncbi:MAG: GGDEF domain-containing protein [Butyrivibrio sp.]|nr:GGDEF domain-containing protein [Butyrivibrio sp.]